ncbi:hypothetical protein AB0940_31080 [Streptomyces sp. NPDC006656]|uniref:hypothetical protein n=1 Tax=Streptomyces sp. NPDC006656 TaxID=3156899 RepID=UPI003454957E
MQLRLSRPLRLHPAGLVLEALAYDKALLMALREATGIPHPIPRGGVPSSSTR